MTNSPRLLQSWKMRAGSTIGSRLAWAVTLLSLTELAFARTVNAEAKWCCPSFDLNWGECCHYAGCERWMDSIPHVDLIHGRGGREVGVDGEACNGGQELLGITGTQHPFRAPVTQTTSKNFERLFDRAYSVIYIPSG